MRLTSPQQRDPVGDHLQRADHPGAGPAGAAGREVPRRSARGRCCARNLAIYGVGGLIAPFIGIKLIDLAVTGLAPRLRKYIMLNDLTSALRPALVMTLLFALLLGIAYPAVITGMASSSFPHRRMAAWSATARPGDRLGADRRRTSPPRRYFHPRPSAAGKGYDADRIRADRTSARPRRRCIDRVTGDVATLTMTPRRRRCRSGRPGDHVRLGARSRHQPRGGALSDRACRRRARARTPKALATLVGHATSNCRCWASSASRASTCWPQPGLDSWPCNGAHTHAVTRPRPRPIPKPCCARRRRRGAGV